MTDDDVLLFSLFIHQKKKVDGYASISRSASKFFVYSQSTILVAEPNQ